MTDYEKKVLSHLQNINYNIENYNGNMGRWTNWEKDQIDKASEINNKMKDLSTRVYWLTVSIVALTLVMIGIMLFQL